MKLIGYARASSEDTGRQVLSIPAQIEWMNSQDVEVIDVFTERMSAKSPGRPVFNEVMDMIQDGKADGIICWKLDRLARNPVDGGMINWALQRGDMQIIKTSSRDYHPQDNVLMMSVEFGMANQYVIDLGKNSKRGLEQKVKMGWFPGRAPAGYKNVSDDMGNKYIDVDPDRWDLVKKMWNLFLTGKYSLHQIAEFSKEWGYLSPQRKKTGGKPLTKGILHKILTNVFYTGHFSYKGELVEGKHPPMITMEDFDKVQELLGRNTVSKGKRQFAYTGFMTCGACHSAITAQEKRKKLKSGEVRKYVYYNCAGRTNQNGCKEPHVNKKLIDAQMKEFLSTIEIDQDWIEFCVDEIKHFDEKFSKERTSSVKMLNSQLDTAKKKLDELFTMRLKKLVTDKEFLETKNSLQKEKAVLIERINQQSTEQNDWIDKAFTAIKYVENITEKFENGTLLEKREIISTIGVNFVLEGGSLQISTNALFTPIQSVAKTLQEEISLLEPRKRLTVDQKPSFDSLRQSWQRVIDDLRTVIEEGFWSPLFTKL